MNLGVLNLFTLHHLLFQNNRLQSGYILTQPLIICETLNSLAAVLSKLKTQWSKATAKDPKRASDQNFLNTPKEPPAKDLFTQVSSKSIESCRWRSVLSIFEKRLQMTPRWPLTPNSWTPPIVSPPDDHYIQVSWKSIKAYSRRSIFSNCGRIDTQIDTAVCHKLIAPHRCMS